MRRAGGLALVGAAIALLAASLGGCGEDDSGDPSAGDDAGDPRAQYVERANSICAELGAETERLAERTFEGLEGAPSRELLREYEREATQLNRRALAELRALPAPPGDEQRVAAILEAAERALEAVARQPLADPGRPSPAVERFNELARDYGLDECAGA